MSSFNLIDRPWIPVQMRTGEPGVLSLGDALRDAHVLRTVAHPSPLVTVAVHRLLLAIAHRVFGPTDSAAWTVLWTNGRWDSGPLDTYLAQWHHRFDLFDSERPFYGTAEVDQSYGRPISNLIFDQGPMNARIFAGIASHTPVTLSAGEAALALLAYQSFSPGGLFPHEAGKQEDKFAKASPLSKGAIALVTGETLFHTLMLNFIRYTGETPIPQTDHADQPAWEQDEPARADQRLPYGYLDWLTWQSRRIRLIPEDGEGDAPVVGRAVYMKGRSLPPGWSLSDVEPMLSFRELKKPRDSQDPYIPIAFQPDHAVWRDSLTLFQPSGTKAHGARTLAWLAELAGAYGGTRALSPRETRPLDLYGLCLDQFNVLFWRHESLPLPLAYVADDEDGMMLRARLALALQVAEGGGRALRYGVLTFAELLLGPRSGRPEGRAPDPKDVVKMVDSLGPTRLYWAQLEAHFTRFLVDQAWYWQEDDEAVYGYAALRAWGEHVRVAASSSFNDAVWSGDTSARTLHAGTEAEVNFHDKLKDCLADLDPHKERQPT